jgi:poly(3-hydroxybutyrate) depolymerase
MKLFFLLLVTLTVQSSYAEWKTETLGGTQVHLYVPKSTFALSGNNPKKSLMINLHGCAQKADDLKKDGNWDNTADDFNMIVAIPKVPNGGVYSGCWDYYGADHTVSNRHSVVVLKIVQELLAKKDLDIDANQVFVSGLSSGGGESMVLGCLAPEVFAGIGLNAAPTTGTTANEISRPSTSYATMLATCKKFGAGKEEAFKTQLTSIIYGNNDYIVNTAFDINNAEVMHTIYNAETKSSFDTKKLEGTSTDGTGTLWSDSKGPRVSLIMNTGLGHNWPAGQGGNGGSFVNKKSINYPDYLAKFFYTNNRRAKSVFLPEVLINPIEVREGKFVFSGSITIPKEQIKTMEVFVKKRSTDELVDKFTVSVDGSNHFEGLTKALLEGEYDFELNLSVHSGVSKIFKRNSWLGEVSGKNAPQLVGTYLQTESNCATLKGQAINNGESKVTTVKAILDETKTFETTVDYTLWQMKICELTDGDHNLSVFAINESGSLSNTESFSFKSSLNSATATLQEHMEAKRLKWEDYGIWYKKYGHNKFTLYLGTDQEWHENPA